MQLYDFTTHTSEDGERIVLVSGRVSTHPDHEQQSEWISFQVAVDVPTVRNGGLLRSEVLKQVRDQLQQLENDYERIGRNNR